MAISILHRSKIKNISNELKKEISNLSFIDDSTIHTININKELIYKRTKWRD